MYSRITNYGQDDSGDIQSQLSDQFKYVEITLSSL